jgi:serine/threonine-protein kinase
MSEVPNHLDRFEILRVLGKGGMGTVYLARDERLGRQVALKVLNPDDLASDDRRARFLREARASASIRHPNVATIYEVDETEDGKPFIVMEYCEGETLSQRMRRRPLDAGEFVSIARQLAAGVAAAHDNGVVHRDIKAANVIIEPNGTAKILDFGLAKLIARENAATVDMPSMQTATGTFFGTLHYLSPEQAAGFPADERSDLFALGVIFFQMATGQFPFNGESPLMILQRIREAEPEPFVAHDPALPPQVPRIIGHLLQKDPLERYPNARTLLRDLEDIESPTVRVTAHTQGTRTAIGRTLPRPHWIRVVVIVIALAVVSTAIYFVRENRTKDDDPAATAAQTQGPIRSMAVLPLENIANNTRDDFLSVGLADALVTKLQKIPSLQVRPTSAVMEFRNQKTDPKLASKKLQVDSILEGHFLAAGDLVRVTLQLTDSRTGYSVWADTVDGKREDLLKLIDDVSARTVTGLNEKLGVQQTATGSEARSTSPKAYEEYLRARALNGTLVPKEYRDQIASLRRAVEVDPNFAAAYADLSIAYSLGLARGLMTDKDANERAEWYARQAVRLDPNLATAHLALGRAFVRASGNRFREATRENLAAVRLTPNDPAALYTIVGYFVATGDLRNAQCAGDHLVRLDPSSSDAKTRGYWYVNAVDAEGALKNAQYALASKDTELAGRDMRAFAFLLQNNLDAAAAEAEKMTALFPTHYTGKSVKAMVAAARGDRPAAEAFLKTFEADAERNHWAALRQMLTYAKLGDRDKAVRWMTRAAELGNHNWYMLVKHPWLVALQGDPEYQQLVAKIKGDLDDVRDDVVGVYQLICPG